MAKHAGGMRAHESAVNIIRCRNTDPGPHVHGGCPGGMDSGPYGPKKLPRTNSSYSGNGGRDFINSNGHLVFCTLTLIYHKKEILGGER